MGFAEQSFQKILHQKAFQSSKKGKGQPFTEAKIKRSPERAQFLVKKFAPNSKTKSFLASLQDRGVQELKKRHFEWINTLLHFPLTSQKISLSQY